jgi:hypothetical protein
MDGRSRGFVHRYGGLIVVVVAVVVIAGLSVRGRTDPTQVTAGPTGGIGGRGGTVPSELAAVSWSQAKAANLSVEFGPHCDTERGRVAIPSAFAAECFAETSGDNGGDTYPGVTADTVKVVVYQPPPDPFVDNILKVINADDTPEELIETYRGFFELYSQTYQLYGRKVEVVAYKGTGVSFDEVAARADALKIAQEIQPFAVIGGPLLAASFSDELAARGVIQIDLASSRSQEFYAAHQPYIWNTLQSPSQTSLHVVEYLSKRLNAKPAIHAGDESMHTQTRRFGHIYLGLLQEAVEIQEDFKRRATEAGVEIVESVAYKDPISLQASAAEQIAKMKDAGVTTVLFTGDPMAPGPLTREATAQNYFPEWIITGSAIVDSTVFGRTYDQRQWAHAFGISQLFARGLPEANFANGLYRWWYGEMPPAETGSLIVYANATILVTGIVGAGPALTPNTFQQGLFAAEPVGGLLTVPQVSFGSHGAWPEVDYTAIDDTVEVWWDPVATGPDERGVEGAGMLRYVDGGQRYLLGEWPTGDPKVFDPDGAVALYREVPPSDRQPDYPPPTKEAG